jgi:hypothetical protein
LHRALAKSSKGLTALRGVEVTFLTDNGLSVIDECIGTVRNGSAFKSIVIFSTRLFLDCKKNALPKRLGTEASGFRVGEGVSAIGR